MIQLVDNLIKKHLADYSVVNDWEGAHLKLTNATMKSNVNKLHSAAS